MILNKKYAKLVFDFVILNILPEKLAYFGSSIVLTLFFKKNEAFLRKSIRVDPKKGN